MGTLKIGTPEPFYIVKTVFDRKWDKTDFFFEDILSPLLVASLTLLRTWLQ